MESTIVAYEELSQRSIAKLREAGVPEADARIVSEVLIHANLRGVSSHGVLRLEHYIRKIAAGGIHPNPQISIDSTGPSTAVLDGGDGLGHVIAKKAMDHAVALSKSTGVGAVGVVNSSHCGALSYYVKEATKENVIGVAMTNTDKLVVPYGGAEPFFGTNPVAIGFPSGGNRNPIVLDMATSTVAYGKILYAREKGESIPPNWAVDSEGQPVTDPHQAIALLPFGGPKGYGLALAIDIFAGILTGSSFGPHVVPMYGDYKAKRKLGHFFLAIDVTRFTSLEVFMESVSRMVDELHLVKPAIGHEQVFVPGEIEDRLEMVRRQEGIPLTEAEYQFLFT